MATVSVGSSLRLEMPHFDRLVIEKIAAKHISVAHYFEQNGDLVAGWPRSNGGPDAHH